MMTTKSSGSPVIAANRLHALAMILMLASSLGLYIAARSDLPALVGIFLGLFIAANLVELLIVK